MSDHLALDAPSRERPGEAPRGGSGFVWKAVFRRTALAGLFVLTAPTLALAQSDTYFDRNNNVSVLDRPRPDYQALGINAGGFQIYPTVTIATEYDDNIFATADPIGDLITTLTPTIDVNSNWSRDAIKLTANATSNFYNAHSAQNTTDYQLTGDGRLDILTQSDLTAGFRVGSYAIPRSAENTFGNTVTPIQYASLNGYLGALQTLNRLQFTERFNYSRTMYDNNTDTNGAPLLFSQQDNSQYVLTGQASYAISPAIAVFASAVINDRLYDVLAPLNRNSSGYETTVGVNFDITRLVRGQIQVGYLAQNYASTTFHTVSGPAFHVQVEYFPSGLDTVTLHLDRSVVDAVDPTAVSFLQSQVGLQLDHELLRNLILSGRAGYETDAYTGVHRNDDRTTASVRGTYFVNRHLGLTAAYSFLNEFSSGSARIPSYRENVVSLSLVLQQ